MPERQLHLFDAPNPLRLRFGDEFFRAAPRRPGVYVMTGAQDRILYIGQSQNLRTRLASYKNARPDRTSRKVIRLVRAVEKISWEECNDAAAAQLRENELLRSLRPKFNRLNTYPRAYWFITLAGDDRTFQIGRTTKPESRDRVFGAFKARAVQGYAALLRLLWAARHQVSSPEDFPGPLLRPRPPMQFAIATDPEAAADLRQMLTTYLDGASAGLVVWLENALPAGGRLSLFQKNLFAQDLETLRGFFEFATHRNRRLRAQHQIGDGVIAQEDLDDLLVLSPGLRASTSRAAAGHAVDWPPCHR